MEITGIEEQIAKKTREEVYMEVSGVLEPLLQFMRKYNLFGKDSEFCVRNGSTYRSIGRMSDFHTLLREKLIKLILQRKTQAAVDKVFKKLTTE